MTVNFTLRLDEDLNEQLDLLVFVERTTKTALIREIIEEYIKKKPPVKDPRK
jgi:predicted DNA-binding protein